MLGYCPVCKKLISVTTKVGFRMQGPVSRTAICLECKKNGGKK